MFTFDFHCQVHLGLQLPPQNMSEESKEIDPAVNADAIKEISEGNENEVVSGEDADVADDAEAENDDAVAAGSSAKKKSSKRAKIKKALGALSKDDGAAGSSGSSANPASKLTTEMVEQLLEMNPSLKNEVAGMDKEKAADTLKKLDVADLLTGMVRILWKAWCRINIQSSR